MISLLIVIVCLTINMLLSGSEMAFVTVNRQELRAKAKKSRSARYLLKLKTNPERTLSVIQIGITLVGAIAAAVGGAGADDLLRPLLVEKYHLSIKAAEILSIAIVVLPISYLNVVVGELVPKTLALRNSMAIASATAPFLYYAEKVLSPIVSLLEVSTNFILKFITFGKKNRAQIETEINIDDLNTQTKQYVSNLISADKKTARDAMIPFTEVIFIKKNDPVEKLAQVITSSRHTRIPVINDEDDHVIGLINSKEFIAWQNNQDREWQSLIRPILKFKAFDGLFKILVKMQESKTRMAIVYFQSKPFGLITMENIFEEIIGDLYDEDDDGLLKKVLASRGQRRPPSSIK